MSLDLDRTRFAAAARADGAQRRAVGEAVRRAADDALETARLGFTEAAAAVYASGSGAAFRDAERLEALASRLVGLLDGLEPAFERLDVARDRCGWTEASGRRLRRSVWDRGELAVLLAETFQPVLSAPALAVLVAACRREALA